MIDKERISLPDITEFGKRIYNFRDLRQKNLPPSLLARVRSSPFLRG